MITLADRSLLGRSDWSLRDLMHIAFLCRALVATLDALLGVQITEIRQPTRRRASQAPAQAAVPPQGMLLVPPRLIAALQAVDALEGPAELEAVAVRVRQLMGAT